MPRRGPQNAGLGNARSGRSNVELSCGCGVRSWLLGSMLAGRRLVELRLLPVRRGIGRGRPISWRLRHMSEQLITTIGPRPSMTRSRISALKARLTIVPVRLSIGRRPRSSVGMPVRTGAYLRRLVVPVTATGVMRPARLSDCSARRRNRELDLT